MCSTRRRKLAETALSVALLLSTLCFQTSAAQSCRSSIPGGDGDHLSVDCTGELLVWRTENPAERLTLKALCLDNNEVTVIKNEWFGSFDFPSEGTGSIDFTRGRECIFYGCYSDSVVVYQFNNVTSCRDPTTVEMSVGTTSMATAEGGPEAATTPDPVTPGDMRSSSGGATFTLTSSERDVAVWVQTVPGVLVLAVSAVLVVLSGTVVAGLYCLLSVRRRNTSTSHRFFVIESAYQGEDGIDDDIISSLGVAPLHSVSTTSVLTLLNTLAHTTVSTPHLHKPTSTDSRFTVTPLSKADTGTRVRLGGSLSEGLTCPPSGVEHAVDAKRRHSLGNCEVAAQDAYKAVWSDLDMSCFSPSGSERFDNNSECTSYFKVENLENCHNIGEERFQTQVHFDSGCVEGSECDYRLSDIGHMESEGSNSSNKSLLDSDRHTSLTSGGSLPDTAAASCKSEVEIEGSCTSTGGPMPCTQSSFSQRHDGVAGADIADDSGFNGAVDGLVI